MKMIKRVLIESQETRTVVELREYDNTNQVRLNDVLIMSSPAGELAYSVFMNIVQGLSK